VRGGLTEGLTGRHWGFFREGGERFRPRRGRTTTGTAQTSKTVCSARLVSIVAGKEACKAEAAFLMTNLGFSLTTCHSARAACNAWAVSANNPGACCRSRHVCSKAAKLREIADIPQGYLWVRRETRVRRWRLGSQRGLADHSPQTGRGRPSCGYGGFQRPGRVLLTCFLDGELGSSHLLVYAASNQGEKSNTEQMGEMA
jgi:hypothetical protein